MKHLLYVIILITASWSYSQDSLHCLSLISNEEDFKLLKGKPNTSKFGEVDALKVLYDIQNESVYFINSNLYDYHVSFCMDYLEYDENSWKFNYDNYTTINNRDYLMGTINRFYNEGLFTLEFSVADKISPEQIELFYYKIIEKFELTNEIKLFINTNRMRLLASSFKRIQTIGADEIYKGQSLQVLNQKETFGILRFIDVEHIESIDVNSTDIVVINGTPNELPPVAGVITTDFQTPLSHITILCQNRGTPVIALKEAWNDSLLRALQDEPVFFKVRKDTFEVIKKSIEEVESYWIDKRAKRKSISLYTDTSIKTILPISLINRNSINIVGGKAANFGELTKLVDELDLNVKTPETAFAIPFHFYIDHLHSNGIKPLITQFIDSKGEGYDDKSIRDFLGSIQHKIIDAKINPQLIKEIEKQIRNSEFTRIRFRSSTNAEDLEGFNGAGLYDSKTGILDNNKKSFERAIKKVWASAWNYKAFMEREFFGIDQKSIAMGVLCHRSFPNEKANGVVITKNLYRPNYRGFVINSQIGETSVVNPPKDVNCEQVICYSDKNDSFYGEKQIVEYLSYSNILPESKTQVLTTKEVVLITGEISKIKNKLYQLYEKGKEEVPYYEYGLDLEFKIYGEERDIYIKQIRPFNN